MSRRVQLFLLIIATTVRGRCPPGSVQGLIADKCYKLVTFSDPSYFLDAEAACTDYGGHLTSVNDAFENAFIKGTGQRLYRGGSMNFLDMLKVVPPHNDIWVGGTNIISPGRWNWTDGKPFTYTNWDGSKF